MASKRSSAAARRGKQGLSARAEQEGRTLLHELLAAAGDIRVCDTELHITLAPLSSPHRTRAAQALCDILDQTATIFPGSRLRIRFAVRPPPRVGLAFPGSPAECSTTPALARPTDRRRNRTVSRYPMSGDLKFPGGAPGRPRKSGSSAVAPS